MTTHAVPTPPAANTSPLAKTNEAAAFLKMQEQTLRGWASRGGPLKPVRIGNRLRWRWADLHELAGGA